MKKIVHFGAGNIGRSLAGQIFSKAGYEVVFVDADTRVVEALNERGQYNVIVKGKLKEREKEKIVVDNVRGLSAFDVEEVADEIADADIIGTSVGANILPKVLPTIARGIALRSKPVSILFCENLRGAAKLAREELMKSLPDNFDFNNRVGLVETSIGKMVPIMPGVVRERDPLEVWAESYNKIVADKAGFVGSAPEIDGLELKNNFSAYVDLKLFIHNFGHAAAAYHGWLAGKKYIWECMEEARIRSRTRIAMFECGKALLKRYPGEFDIDYIGKHIEDLISRFSNRELGDTVYRVGRDLCRKLGPDDRCIGALNLVKENGGRILPACRVVAAALNFHAKDENGESLKADSDFLNRALFDGIRFTLQNHCKISEKEICETICGEYSLIQSKRFSQAWAQSADI